MDIRILDQQKALQLRIRNIESCVGDILKALKVQDATLTFVFVSRQKICALNKKFLNRTYATDVLAFDLSENLPEVLTKSRSRGIFLFGDIAISTDAVLRNIKEFKTTPSPELALYIIHGILHLMGYDDHSPTDVKKMRAKEQELLTLLGTKAQRLITP